MAELAIDAARSLRLEIASMDVLYDETDYRICGANSSPGFKGLQKACRISVPGKVFDFVTTRLSRPPPAKVSIWTKLLRCAGKRDISKRK